MPSSPSKVPKVRPRRTMRGHTNWITGVVHLPGGRHIITCSCDRSFRLWDLESGAQIGEEWKYEYESEAEVSCMSLSPNNKTIASGSSDGTMRLWDVETKKIISKWTGNSDVIWSLCWSANGKRVAGAFLDGTARAWDVKSGEIVLTIKTGYNLVWAVMYSPDDKKIATGGDNENINAIGVKIWDSKTGRLITTLKYNSNVFSLTWTSDGKKLIASSTNQIRIFDTTTWEQIGVLEGHSHRVKVMSLSSNNRLLACISWSNTARLWNLDTNLQIGQPLEHEDKVHSAALSADGKVLVTGCENKNAYTWDINAILKKAGLEDLLLPISDIPDPKSLMTRDATRRPAIQARRIPPAFFDGAQSSAAYDTHHHSSTHDSHLKRLSSFFRHSPSKNDGATERQQRPRRTIFSRRGPRIVDVPTVQDRKPLVVAPRPRPQQQSQLHGQTQASSSQTQHTTTSTSAQSPHIPWWARLVLFLCCASPPHANGH